jgi:hypothetical protein
LLAQLLAEDARLRVRGAARRKGDDDAYGLVGERLGIGMHRNEKTDRQKQAKDHETPA